GEIADNARSSFDASLETWRRLAVYGTMAIMTDVFGFLTIYLIPIDIIREMSINATLGMAAIIVTNKVMMPILLTWMKVGDPRAFRDKQERRDSIFDPVWRVLTITTDRVVAAAIIVLCGMVLGWALWKGQWLQVGDSQAGVPELLPKSRYNQDSAAIGANFAIGTDVLKVIAETDADACADFEVMDQVDRFTWRMRNTPGVQSTLSLPEVGKQVNAAFNEASPKFRVLPRNTYVMVQAITPVPTSSGLLNADCSALAVLTFTRDHRAATLDTIVAAVKQFNEDNARQFFDDHKEVEANYCEGKRAARREIGTTRVALQRLTEKLKKKGFSDDKIAADARIKAAADKLDAATEVDKNFDKACPVNFALASANVGVMAATNEEVHRLEKRTLFYVYLAIVFCVFVSFFEWESIVAIMLPLGLVSWTAYAVMAMLGIGMKVATLPVVALAVGIGVDYGIYIYATMADAVHGGFAIRDAYYRTLKMTGKAVIFTGVTLALGVFTWLWSGLQFQRDMGKLLVFMFTANMFGAILILPAIASFLLKPRQLAPGEKPVMRSEEH